MSIAPPGRASISHTGFVNPCGPHHCSTCFGSIQTLKTSERGASMSRVITSSCAAVFDCDVCVVTKFPLFACSLKKYLAPLFSNPQRHDSSRALMQVIFENIFQISG